MATPPVSVHITRSITWGGHCIFALALVALLVLAGYVLEIPELTRLAPGMKPMNPMGAVSFLLCALSLWLVRDPAQLPRMRLARLPAAAVMLFGLSKVLDLAAGTSWCPDLLLFADQLLSPEGTPYRLSPNAASCFLLYGIALLLASREDAETSWVTHPQLPLFPILILSLFAVVGYLYQEKSLYALKSFAPMACHTALCFLLASASLLMLRPKTGLMGYITSESAAGFSTRMLLGPCILIPVTLGWFLLRGSGAQGALMVVLMVVVLVILIMGNAAWLFRLDVRRRRSDRALEARVEHERQLAQLNEKLAGLEEIIRASRTDLSRAPREILTYLATHLGASQACFYQTLGSLRTQRKLRVLASYAGDAVAQLDQQLDWGEGLAGQCAAQGRVLSISDVPRDYWRIRSGMIDALPRHLLLVPVLLDDEVLGVLEFATLTGFSPEHLKLLEGAARVLGFALFRLRAEVRTAAILRREAPSDYEAYGGA